MSIPIYTAQLEVGATSSMADYSVNSNTVRLLLAAKHAATISDERSNGNRALVQIRVEELLASQRH